MEIDLNPIVTVDSLLKSCPSLQRIPNTDRIKCKWTQHEMPARVDAIEKYIHGKKYQQLLKKKFDSDYLDKFKEFLEPSTKKNHERQLFCKLTSRHLNKEPHHIMKHIEGKRFKRAYALWQECQANGTEYVPAGRRKKKQDTSKDNDDDDDEYVDLSDDEVVIEDDDDDEYVDLSDDEVVIEDDDDDLSDLYPDFRRLRASDSAARTTTEATEEESTSGTKRKAQTSQMKKQKKLAATSSKRMRTSDENVTNGNDPNNSTKIVTMLI